MADLIWNLTQQQLEAILEYTVHRPDCVRWTSSATPDALTASALIADDKLIVTWHAFKIETVDWTGATIIIRTPLGIDQVGI